MIIQLSQQECLITSPTRTHARQSLTIYNPGVKSDDTGTSSSPAAVEVLSIASSNSSCIHPVSSSGKSAHSLEIEGSCRQASLIPHSYSDGVIKNENVWSFQQPIKDQPETYFLQCSHPVQEDYMPRGKVADFFSRSLNWLQSRSSRGSIKSTHSDPTTVTHMETPLWYVPPHPFDVFFSTIFKLITPWNLLFWVDVIKSPEMKFQYLYNK